MMMVFLRLRRDTDFVRECGRQAWSRMGRAFVVEARGDEGALRLRLRRRWAGPREEVCGKRQGEREKNENEEDAGAGASALLCLAPTVETGNNWLGVERGGKTIRGFALIVVGDMERIGCADTPSRPSVFLVLSLFGQQCVFHLTPKQR